MEPLGFKKNNNLKKRQLTTLDSLNLHKDLEEMKKSKIDNVIIEASSHGLIQNRLDFLNIKSGIFTNLSHDHLDYHKNMKNYFSAKLILFKKLLKKNRQLLQTQKLRNIRFLSDYKKRKTETCKV